MSKFKPFTLMTTFTPSAGAPIHFQGSLRQFGYDELSRADAFFADAFSLTDEGYEEIEPAIFNDVLVVADYTPDGESVRFVLYNAETGEEAIVFDRRFDEVPFLVIRDAIPARLHTEAVIDGAVIDHRADHTVLAAVAKRLAERGWLTSVEFPGCVHILTSGSLFIAGTVNPTWGMDYYADANRMETVIESFALKAPSSSQDVEVICDEIALTIIEFLIEREANVPRHCGRCGIIYPTGAHHVCSISRRGAAVTR